MTEIIGGVKVEGGRAVISIPLDKVHSLRVALQPVRVGEVVSRSTQDVRDSLDKALAAVERKVGRV